MQAGQFKGVADVRLRINFQEQLAALSLSAQSDAIDAGTGVITGAVEVAVADLLASEEVTEEQRTEIESRLNIFISAVNDAAGETGEEVFLGINSAFNEFDSALRELLGLGLETPAPVESEVIEEETPVESGDEPLAAISEETEPDTPAPRSLADLVDAIQLAFDNAVTSIQEAADQAGNTLPELSPPNGNGVAYQKFVDILQGLNEEAASEEPAETESILEGPTETNSIDENI